MWRENKEAKLAENGGIVVQRIWNLCVCCYGEEKEYSKSSKVSEVHKQFGCCIFCGMNVNEQYFHRGALSYLPLFPA